MKGFERQRGGSKLYEFMYVVILVGALSAIAEKIMMHYIEIAEKTAMETTVMNLQASLRLRLAELIAHNDQAEAVRLSRDNPMNWLQEHPPNYLGEFDGVSGKSMPLGKWYYDRSARELVYLVDQGEGFEPDSMGQKRVRYRVATPFVARAAKENRSVTVNEVVEGISLTPVERYVWEFK